MGECKVYVTRRVTFAAAHRLFSKHLTEEENVAVYGKCYSNINGHGHNYEVIVTLYGVVKENTGMIMNVVELNKYMQQVIVERLDHKHLDKDVPYFKDRPSTVENLVQFIWENMKNVLPEPELLYEVMIEETKSNTAIYRGDGAR